MEKSTIMNYLNKITGKSKDKKEVPDQEPTSQSTSVCICSELSGTFFFSRNQTHFWHLVSESYAEHKALNQYYDAIIDFVDAFAESFQGSYGKMKKPVSFGELKDYSPEAVKEHFKTLETKCDEFGKMLKDTDGHLKNILDEIKALVTKTSYLLSLS